MFTIILYLLAFGLLVISFLKDRKKTKMALKKAWKSFENILPQLLSILIIIGIIINVISTFFSVNRYLSISEDQLYY